MLPTPILSRKRLRGVHFVCLGLGAALIVFALMPVHAESLEANELPNYKDMDFKEGVSYLNPTPFLNGLPQECLSGGYACYYEWGVS